MKLPEDLQVILSDTYLRYPRQAHTPDNQDQVNMCKCSGNLLRQTCQVITAGNYRQVNSNDLLGKLSQVNISNFVRLIMNISQVITSIYVTW